jgi:hypothetical protein
MAASADTFKPGHRFLRVRRRVDDRAVGTTEGGSPMPKHGGERSGSGGNSKQGGTTAQKKAAGRKGGNASAKKKRS